MIRDTRGGLWVAPDNSMAKVGRIEAVKELHERYRHISYDTLRSLLECPNFEEKPRCETCEKGKAEKPPALPRMQPIRTSRALERLHCDLVRPINPITPRNQYKYLLVTTDDYSRYTIVKSIKTKDRAASALISIINILEVTTSQRFQQVQAD
jgi:hypothetical protein